MTMPKEEQKKPTEEKEEKSKSKKGKKAKIKGKKQRTGRKHESQKEHQFYSTEGDKLKRKKKPCPRCGAGTWLAEHQGRLYCGRCHYTEFEKKSEDQ